MNSFHWGDNSPAGILESEDENQERASVAGFNGSPVPEAATLCYEKKIQKQFWKKCEWMGRW